MMSTSVSVAAVGLLGFANTLRVVSSCVTTPSIPLPHLSSARSSPNRRAIDPTYFRPSKTVTQDPLKGEAHYYDVVVDGVEVKDAAWYYPNPKSTFIERAGFVTFCTYAPIMLVMRRVPLRFRKFSRPLVACEVTDLRRSQQD